MEKIHQNPLVVAGFHRSGTSMTMQALVKAGLNPGPDLIAASPSNPDGHFEDRSFVDLHETAFVENDVEWHSAGSPINAFSETLTEAARQLVEARRNQCLSSNQRWGFKDPRVCLFLDSWKELIPDAGFVVVYRDYLSCLHSLRNRQAQGLVFNPLKNQHQMFFWQDPVLSLELWLSHNKALLEFIEKNRDRCLVVSHQALLNGFDLIHATNTILHMSLDDSQPSGITKNHHHACADRPIEFTIPETLKRDLDETLMRLNALAHSPGCRLPTVSIKDSSTLDSSALSKLKPKLQGLGITLSNMDAERTTALEQAENPGNEGNAVEQADDLKHLIAQAKQKINDKAFQQARMILEPLRIRAPKNIAILLHLARCAYGQNRAEEALDCYVQALALNEEKHALWVGLVRAQLDCGRTRAALSSCIEARQRWPDSIVLAQLHADMLLELGQAEEVLQLGNDIMALGVDHYRIQLKMAQALVQLNRQQEARDVSRNARRLLMASMADYETTLLAAIENIENDTMRHSLIARVETELEALEPASESHLQVA